MRTMHPKLCRTLLGLVSLVATATGGFCGDLGASGGTYAFESLRRASTAQETIFGGVCGEGAPEAARGNPASLGNTKGLTFGASHQTWQGDLQEQWAGAAFPIPRGGVSLGVSAYHAGALDAFAPDGAPLGSFRPVELLGGLGLGIALKPGLRAGVSLHGLYLGSQGDALTGTSMSAGCEMDLWGTTVGIVARNLGPAPGGEQGAYRLPAEVSIAARSDPRRRAIAGIGFARDREGEMRGTVGSRVRVHPRLSLMAGLRYEEGAGEVPYHASAGFELQLAGIEIAYAVTPGDEMGTGQIVSVRFTRSTARPRIAARSAPGSKTPAGLASPAPAAERE